MTALNILMLAAENDALPGGKVGGIGDVVRDVPPALVAQGCQVHVVTPAYHSLARLAGATRSGTIPVSLGGETHSVDLYEIVADVTHAGVRHWVLDHPAFSPCGTGRIYCDDGADSPFATDASKFALYCTAVAELIRREYFGRLDVLHAHDWHAALLLVLRHYHADYRFLQQTRCVYTIHNLSLQGVRPLEGHESSLSSWYPGLSVDPTVTDPRWPECINLMRAGINLADKVHAVSPSYAAEILQPSDVEERGFFGGEGLERDLQKANHEGRLIGILNGCDYPAESEYRPPRRAQLEQLLQAELCRWISREQHVSSAHFIADKRLQQFAQQDTQLLITSVGRVTDQKVSLLQQRLGDGRTALEALLECLGQRGSWIFLGSGDEVQEQFLSSVSAHYDNFIFLRGYSERVAQALYQSGDLFLMPSSFEPCGISQMLAMRAGQPCLVHRVGGLNDTVDHEINGFSFSGESLQEQAQALVQTCKAALDRKLQEPLQWKRICNGAAQARFTWKNSIERYLGELYRS